MSTNEEADRRLPEVADIVQALVETMRSNGLIKLDVTVGDVSIRLRAGGARKVVAPHTPSAEPQAELTTATPEIANGHIVTAPMIGTFYSSPAPGEPPFVRSGERVDAGQVIGIIEAMKIMNEIVSDRAGIVAEMIAGNGQPVEYGSPLLRIIPDEIGG